MMRQAASFTLLCPGLLGPVPILPQPRPDTPTLDAWLSRATRRSDGDRDVCVSCLRACGVGIDPDADPPVAPLALLGEGWSSASDASWMCADPVHLRADRDQLLVFSEPSFRPTRAEADALISSFNQHFAEDGLRLVAPSADRWYLRVEGRLELRTTPLYRVLGRSMALHLPDGPSANRWMRLMNEAQMLFFDHPVNIAREACRRPAINGIWTWGGGVMPAAPTEAPDLVIGDDPALLGLARLAGAEHRPITQPWVEALGSSKSAVMLFDLASTALLHRDLDRWAQALESLEDVAGKLDPMVRQGRLRLLLDPCDGQRFEVVRRRLWQPWRRRRLADWIRAGADVES